MDEKNSSIGLASFQGLRSLLDLVFRLLQEGRLLEELIESVLVLIIQPHQTIFDQPASTHSSYSYLSIACRSSSG